MIETWDWTSEIVDWSNQKIEISWISFRKQQQQQQKKNKNKNKNKKRLQVEGGQPI